MNDSGFSLRLLSGLLLAALAAPAALAAGAASAPVASGAAEQVPDKEKVLVKARASYYSLHKEGLGGYKCSLVPNWEKMLHDAFKTMPEGAEQKLRELHKIHFELSVSGSGVPSIQHHVEGELDPEVAENLGEMYTGMEQMVGGFFATWRGFMMQPLLPEPVIEYRLEKTQYQYRISYKEEGADVVTLLGEDLAIRSLHVTSKEFDSTVRPQFTKTAGGFVLASYDAVYQNLSPPSLGVLHVKIDNRLVDGFQLPVKIFVSGEDDGTQFAIEVSFTDCHATRR